MHCHPSAQRENLLPSRRHTLLAQTKRLIAAGIDHVQLREKDLDAGELVSLAEEMARLVLGSKTKLLINARADIAIAACAHGVHLTAHPDELTPQQVREIFKKVEASPPVISVSCHTMQDVEQARTRAADLILFGPVFEKRVDGEVAVEGSGVEALREACHAAGAIPVFALGGITAANVDACLLTGAAGVAGIRIFQ